MQPVWQITRSALSSVASSHCKRTGKRCVFVEKPSRASLQRALNTLVPPRVAEIVAIPAPTAPTANPCEQTE